MIQGLSIRPSFGGFCKELDGFFETGSLASFQLSLIFYHKEGASFALKGREIVLLDADLDGVAVGEVFEKVFPKIDLLVSQKIATYSPASMFEMVTKMLINSQQIVLDVYETPQKWISPSEIREITLEECEATLLLKASRMFELEDVGFLLVRFYQGAREDGWLEMVYSFKLFSSPIEGESREAFRRALAVTFRAKAPIAYFEIVSNKYLDDL
jgi:hypothetical protein